MLIITLGFTIHITLAFFYFKPNSDACLCLNETAVKSSGNCILVLFYYLFLIFCRLVSYKETELCWVTQCCTVCSSITTNPVVYLSGSYIKHPAINTHCNTICWSINHKTVTNKCAASPVWVILSKKQQYPAVRKWHRLAWTWLHLKDLHLYEQ